MKTLQQPVRLLAIILTVLAMSLAHSLCLAHQTTRPYFLTIDRNDSNAVMKAANAAYEQHNYLVAQVLYKRLLQVMPGDPLSSTRLHALQGPAQNSLNEMTAEERTSYEEYAAKVLNPDGLAKVPAMRTGMHTYLASGDLDGALSYANSILEILPDDREALGCRSKWISYKIDQGDKAEAQGELGKAAQIYSLVNAVDPAAVADKMSAINDIASLKDALAKAVADSDEESLESLLPKLKSVAPSDEVVQSAEKKLLYLQNLREWSTMAVPLTVIVHTEYTADLDLILPSGTYHFKAPRGMKAFWNNITTRNIKVYIPDFCGGEQTVRYQAILKNSLGRVAGGYTSGSEESYTFVNSPEQGTWLEIDTYSAGGDARASATAHDSSTNMPGDYYATYNINSGMVCGR